MVPISGGRRLFLYDFEQDQEPRTDQSEEQGSKVESNPHEPEEKEDE